MYHLDHGDVPALADELMVGFGGVGPAPGIGEGVELRLAHLAADLTEEDVVSAFELKGGSR